MRKLVMMAQRGFSILELSLVLFIGAGVLTTMLVVLQQVRLSQSYETYSALQAREMAVVKEAASKYVKTQQATMTLGQRIEYDASTLITAGFLPTDFALRDTGGGTRARPGTSPFGQPYKIVSIKDVLDKKVRTVIYDDGVPVPARLARVGVSRIASAILSLKADIAGKGVSTQKTITGTVTAGLVTATGYLNSFANFNVEPWILAAPSEALTMVFLGFPELGDTGTTGTGGPRYTNCNMVDGSAQSRCDSGDFECQSRGVGYVPPSCSAPLVEVKRWRITSSFSLVDTPVGTLTTGLDVVTGMSESVRGCGPGGSDLDPRPSSTRYAVTTLNNATALRQLVTVTGYIYGQQSCPSFGTSSYFAGENVMCCEEVVE